jgi:hypothetical protein
MDALGFAIASIILQQQDKTRNGVKGTVHGAEGKKSSTKGNWHPVASWSWSMLPVEWNYAIGNHEMLAIIMSCCHWHHHLEGAKHPVEVLMDHHNLQRYMTTKVLRD